jgi:hypothetical protein
VGPLLDNLCGTSNTISVGEWIHNLSHATWTEAFTAGVPITPPQADNELDPERGMRR